MSKFWQKKYISKYTGEEIDAAVAKADTVPSVTVEDAGRALVVNAEGKIVPGEVGGGGTKVTVNVSVDPDDPTSFVATTSMYSTAIVAATATGIVYFDIVFDASMGDSEIIQTAFFIQPGDDNPPTPSIIVSGSFSLLGVTANYSLIITEVNALISISM